MSVRSERKMTLPRAPHPSAGSGASAATAFLRLGPPPGIRELHLSSALRTKKTLLGTYSALENVCHSAAGVSKSAQWHRYRLSYHHLGRCGCALLC